MGYENRRVMSESGTYRDDRTFPDDDSFLNKIFI